MLSPPPPPLCHLFIHGLAEMVGCQGQQHVPVVWFGLGGLWLVDRREVVSLWVSESEGCVCCGTDPGVRQVSDDPGQAVGSGMGSAELDVRWTVVV